MSAALRARIPTLAVMVMTAGLVVALALALLPLPESEIEKFSVRSRHESQRALQEANASVAAAAAAQPGEVPQPAAALTQNSQKSVSEIPAPTAALSADNKVRLEPAPIAELTETFGEDAVLPRIAGDGRAPWQAYARPAVAAGNTPKAIIVIAGLGTNKSVTNEAIERLPGAVTLVIDAQAHTVPDILQQAREAGHETLLALPAEPFDYPQSDPGPETLLTNLSANENIRRLRHFMSLGSGYVGLTTLTGSRYLSVPKSAQLLLNESRQRGLALLDARLDGRGALLEQAAKDRQPAAGADLMIQADMTSEEINGVLAQVEALARQRGVAICLVYASPLVIDRLHRWLPTLSELGILLAPFSSALK